MTRRHRRETRIWDRGVRPQKGSDTHRLAIPIERIVEDVLLYTMASGERRIVILDHSRVTRR